VRADTIPARLLQHARTRPSAPAYYVKQEGTWVPTTWADYATEVRRAARALMTLGLRPGDKVAMLGFNRPEWTIFNLGAMSAGGVGTGIYTTCSAEEVGYVVRHAEARAILLEDESQWRKIASQRSLLPCLEHVIMMKGAAPIDDPLVMTWEELDARADETPDTHLEERLDSLSPDSLATLIYTSGTTGPFKGVMLSHHNLAWTASVGRRMIGVSDADCVLSYLPLSHIAEQMITIHVATTAGAAAYYAESLARVADNLREVQPTALFGVPRIWEKLHAAVSARLAETRGPKKALIDWARRIALRVHARRNQGNTEDLVLGLQYRLANHLVLSKIKKALGLSRARMCASGAAPIAEEILAFFASLDIVIHEIYGQSEGSGPTTFNGIGKTRFGTVGTTVPGVEIRIADDGEILVRGENVFMGYYKDEAATRETLSNGWLHTGDLGELDEQGFLTITGRKKEIIITSGGKNIAPKGIETALKSSRLISEAVVIGDRRKYLSALITLDEEAVAQLIEERGLTPAPVDEIPALRAAVQDLVDEVNSHLAQVETIKKFTILRNNFSIEQGELTPTLKIRRQVVNQRYEALIDAMYDDGQAAS
jgi:long-chain acyl-CoA synthetase